MISTALSKCIDAIAVKGELLEEFHRVGFVGTNVTQDLAQLVAGNREPIFVFVIGRCPRAEVLTVDQEIAIPPACGNGEGGPLESNLAI